MSSTKVYSGDPLGAGDEGRRETPVRTLAQPLRNQLLFRSLERGGGQNKFPEYLVIISHLMTWNSTFSEGFFLLSLSLSFPSSPKMFHMVKTLQDVK